PELLASIQIPLTALALLHYVPRAAGEHPLQFATALHGPDRAFAGPARRLPGQCVHQLVADLRELRTAEVCTEQSDTARDVEADTAGRDHSPGTDVRSRHTTDREAISPMDVRHGIGGADDPRQRRDVGHLLQRPIPGSLGQQPLRREDHARHAHVAGRVDPEPVRRLLDQLHPGHSVVTQTPRTERSTSPLIRCGRFSLTVTAVLAHARQVLASEPKVVVTHRFVSSSRRAQSIWPPPNLAARKSPERACPSNRSTLDSRPQISPSWAELILSRTS